MRVRRSRAARGASAARYASRSSGPSIRRRPAAWKRSAYRPDGTASSPLENASLQHARTPDDVVAVLTGRSPHDVVAARCAPHDVVAVRGAPHDVVAVARSP